MKTAAPLPPAAPAADRKEASGQRFKKWKNWWYYYKWYVVCAALVSGVICNVAGSALGLWTKAPDLQIAYVGKSILPEETVSALEQVFTSIGGDFNGDGEIKVQINQYISGISNPDAETAYYEYGGEIALIGDISDCESYFFLTDDPDGLQREFQILACQDGSCPDEMDYSTEDKVISWSGCPMLRETDLGSYTAISLGREITGSNQELLSGLFLGRRCFYMEDTTENADQCGELWKQIWEGSHL